MSCTKCAAGIRFSCGHLCCVFRYAGQTDWFRADQRGRFSWDFLNHKDTALEEVDMSYTIINYTGLENLGTELHLSLICLFQFLLETHFFCFYLILLLCHVMSSMCCLFQRYSACKSSAFSLICLPSVGQQSLRILSLRGCPEVDDWFLARLHVLQDSLEELDISHCPRITTGGLAALRNLK